jgi:thioredoxin reductase (NADPH)
MQHRDIIVIGAGPAGLAAGFYLAHYGIDTIIFDESIAGGYAAEIPVIENYPGCVGGMSGKDLVDRMVAQCKKAGAEIRQFEKVIELNFGEKKPVVKTEKSNFSTEAIIIASGRYPKMLGVPGEDHFKGKGVSHCAVCDGQFFRDKNVVVVGEDRRAAEVAIFLSKIASQVKLVCRKEELCAERVLLEDLEEQKVEILGEMDLKEIKGDMKVNSVVLLDKATGNAKEIDVDGVFVQLEGVPNSKTAKESGIKVDKDGYILVDDKGKTNIDNIYAIGDVIASPTKLVVTATAQAATAALDVLKRINRRT